MSKEQQAVGKPMPDEWMVRDYLERYPDFFSRHRDLLEKVRLPHDQRGSVSLVDIQLERLREKNRCLQEEITELMEIAACNERIYRVYSELYVQLLECDSLDAVLHILETQLKQELELPIVALRLCKERACGVYQQLALLPDESDSLISRRLARQPYYFGRLTKAEQTLLFDQESVESVALILLGDDECHGILAIGSNDPNHFQPNMDALLLEQVRILLSTKLPTLFQNDLRAKFDEEQEQR
jgi:uncharacterized protein YigA (DUF484 family)